MEVTREALTKLVAAARASAKLAEAIEALLVDKNALNVADEITGDLQDALFLISGERLDGKPFTESMTMRLLTNVDINNGCVADWFFMMEKLHNHIQQDAEQPKPHTMSQEEFRKMYVQNGGYSTPEGEFT